MTGRRIWHTWCLAAAIAFLFMAQFATAIPPGEPPVLPTAPPPPPRPPDTVGWLCLDDNTIRASATFSFELYATNASWVIARVDGCDAADITIKKRGEILQRFTAYPGTPLCSPIWFTNETWPDGYPVEGVSNRYTMEIESSQTQYYSMLAILPQVLAQGNATLSTTGWHEMPFLAAGRVYCLFDSNFSVSDFAAQILVAGAAQPLVLKRDDYPGAEQYPMNFSAVAAAVEGNRYLQLSADLPAGQHVLQLKGAGEAEWIILADGDNDQDGLSDVTEVQQDLDLATPDVWGYRTVTGATETLQDLSDALAAGNYGVLATSWQLVTLNLYIPVAVGAIPIHAAAENGHFENFTIDGDPFVCGNMTLDGFQGTGENPIQFYDNESNWRSAPEWQFTYPDTRFMANLATGPHTISFMQRENPLDPPLVSFFSPMYPITELGQQKAANPAVDSDNDGLSDGMDREPLDALQWHPETALRLAIPYTFEDRQDQADLQVTLSVAPPEHDYTTRAAPVAWHVGEGQDGTGVKCHVVPVVRCYGLGPAGRDDYWYKSTTWEQFWGKSVVTQSLVGVDASGTPYNAAATGLSFLPAPTNETSDPGKGNPADGYTYFLYPEQANKSWAYTLRIPRDHPLLQNTTKIPVVTFDFAWQVLEENPNNGTLSLAHIYSCLDNVTIQSAVETYTATTGPGGLRYILGKPTSHAEYVALQALAANPSCEVIQSAGARLLNQSIVKAEQGVGLLPMYHYNKDNLTTISIADRIARWREIYPRNPGDSEVVFYCGKEKTINLLQELAAGVQYDCHADPTTIPSGEIQYADVPATWSFGGLADTTRAYNIDNDWAGGPWDGSENAQVITRARHFRKVLQLQPYKDAYNEWVPAWASVVAGAAADNASVEFWSVLGRKANEDAPDGILDIKISDASGTIGPWLRFDGERMEFGSRNPETGETTFKVLDDVAVWPDEPIHVALWYNCTNGTFFIDLGGAAYNLQNFVPFHDPANRPAALQVVNFTASYVDACIDAVGLTQAPRGTGDCGGGVYNRSNNAVDYAAWHAGDEERLVAWSHISNVSQEEIPPEQLQGDYSVLWEKTYQEVIHAHEEIELFDVPLQIKLTRARDVDNDGFEETNYVEIFTARGSTQVGNIPQSIRSVQAGNIADEEIYFNHQVTNERVTSNAINEPPLVQFEDALDVYLEREDYRQTEVDWWEHFYRPGSMRLSDLTWMKIREVIEHYFETEWQAVRISLPDRINDIVNHIFDVEELVQAACAAAGEPYIPPSWTWDILLPGNGFWFAPGFYGLDVQNGQLTGSIINQLGVAVRRPDTDPGTFWVQAAQLGPGQIVQLSKNNVAFRRTFTLANLPEVVTRVTNAMDFIDKCHLAQLEGKSVPMLVWAKLKDKFKEIPNDVWQNIKQQITPILKDGKLTLQQFLDLKILRDNGITNIEQLFEPTKITGAMQEGLAPYPDFALVLPVKMTRELLAKVNKAAAMTKEVSEIVASYPGNLNQQHIGDLFNIPSGTPRDGASLASGINWGKRAVLPDHVLVELWKAWGPDAVEIERQLAFLELCIDGTRDKHGNIIQPGYADMPLPLPNTPTRAAFMASLPAGYWPGMTMLDQWNILTGKTGFNDVLAGYFGAPHRLAGYASMNYDLLCQRALWFNPNAFGSQNNPLRVKNAPSGTLPPYVKNDPLYQRWRGMMKNIEFSTPRQERVMEKWRHKVEYFQKLFLGAGGLSPAEFEHIARDIARTLVEDLSLGLKVDAAGNINFLQYIRNPALSTMMSIMEEGWWESQLNRADRILSLTTIFGEENARALIARGKELVPSFAGSAKKVAATILERTRDWIGSLPGGAEMTGPEFLAIQYSLSDFNLEMLAAGPDFNWELYYEFLKNTYGPGLKGWGPMGGGLPLYMVMEFPTEKAIKIYMKSMGWELDYAYSVLMQWRAAQLKVFSEVPALPSPGFTSQIALIDNSIEAIQQDTFAIETSKALQEYQLIIDDEVFFKYLDAWLELGETGGYGVVMTEIWYEPLYAPATTGWKGKLGIDVWNGWRVTDAIFEVIESCPPAASTWASRGMDALVRCLPAIFLNFLARVPDMISEVNIRVSGGQPALAAWGDMLLKYIPPVLIETLVDVYIVSGICEAIGLTGLASAGGWSGLLFSGIQMGIYWWAAMIGWAWWQGIYNQQEQYLADVLTELNVAVNQEWIFPEATNRSVAMHGGLEVGDAVILKTTVENRGTREYHVAEPQNGDGYGEGSAFWYQARYMVQGASNSWTDWLGHWGNATPLYEMRTYYGPLHEYWFTFPRSPPDVQYYPITLTQACTSPTLACEFEVASEFHTWTPHGVQQVSQPLAGFHVMEPSITAFMASTTPIQSPRTVAELQAECARARNEFRWKDATRAAQQANTIASVQPIVSEAEFQDILARRVELGIPGAPQGYDPFWGYWQNFTAEEQQAYALLACTGPVEYAKFFPAPGSAGAMRFAQQGFRAVAPSWASLANPVVLEETFASTSWSLLQQRGWDVSSRAPYGMQYLEIRPQYEGRNGTLYIDEEDNDRAFEISHAFQAMTCGETSWDFYHLFTKPWGINNGFDPVYLDLISDMGVAVNLYIDNDVIYCNGQPLAAAAEYTWYSFRVTWDCFAGTCAVWANGQLLQAGIPLLLTRPVNLIKFRTGVADIFGRGAIDHVQVSGEGGYLGAQRLGYWNTEPAGLILIPKSWFNLTQQAFEAKNQSQVLLASIPLQTNIASHPSWGDPFIMVTPGTSTTGAIAFTIDGPDNPLVKVDLIAPPGITATFTPWVGFLHNLRMVNFTLHAEPGVYASVTYLLLNVSCNGNVTAYQRVIPVRLAYEESSKLAIQGGPVLVEPGGGFRWATLYNNGTVPQGYLATFAGLPEGWLHGDAYVPIVASTFDTGPDGWVGTCTSNINLEMKVRAYAGNLVMEAPQQAEQLSATLTFPAPIEVRPGDVVRLSVRGKCTGGISLVAGQSFQVLAPELDLTNYNDVELAFTEFHTISNLTLIGSFKPGDNVWVDAVVLEACTTRHAHEVWQQFSDATASLNDYGWNVTFASGTPVISAWGSITNLAYTSVTDPNANYGTATTLLMGPGYNTFIQIPEYPSALLPYANLSSVGQYLYLLHDPAYNNEAANLFTWATGSFNETTSGSFPGVTWATQLGFTHQLGNYSLGAGMEPAWIRIDASGRAWIGLNSTAPHQFWSDDAGDEESRPAVRFTIPKAGMAGGYLVVQSDVADAFNLTLDLGKNLSMNAGDSIRLGFNVTGAMPLNVTAGEFFAINPSAAGRFEMVLPFTITIANLANLTIKGALPAGGSFNLDFLEVYHVQPFGDVLGNTTLGGIYNDTTPLNTIKGYSPLIACTFSGTLDGFESTTAPDLPACIVVNGSLYINGSSPAPEDIPIRRVINAQLPAGARVRIRACLNATEVGALIIEGPGLYHKQLIPVTSPGNWSEVIWTCTEASMITWITLDACLSAGEYLAVDYVLVEQPANAQPVPYAVGRRDVLPLKMAGGYLSTAEITFGDWQASGIWEGWVYLPFLGAALGLAFLDRQRRLACQLTFNNTHLVVTNGTGIAVTTGEFSFFQHVQVAWDTNLGNWSVKVNNITAFPVNYTDATGILSLAPAITSLASLRLDIGDAGTYYLDGVQSSWFANYTGSFAQLVSNGSGMAFWLTPGERRVFYVTPTRSLPNQSFLALFADAFTGQIWGAYDGEVISQPSCNIGLSSLSPVTQYCVAGEQLTYTMKVTNEGTLSDTFWLSCDNYGSATYSLTPASINLRPGESVCAKLVVSPTSLDVNYFTVRVASTHNETVLHLWVVANEVSFIQIPDEISYVVGTTGNTFSWSASACWTGDPSYSLAVDGSTMANGLDWVRGETVLVSIDGLEVGTHTMEVRISAGAFGVDAAHTVAINVLPSEPLPPDTTTPLIQVTGEMEPTYPIGDIVVTAAFSDTGGSGLAQTLLYYTTGDWSAANCVSFDGTVATIPMYASAVLLGSYYTVGPQACTLSYFLYARDAAGNGAILDQDGWRVASASDVSSYSGVPYSVQVVNTPVVGSLRLSCDHVLGAGSGLVFPALFTLYYPGNDYAWRRPFYARAFINIGSDVRFIDATCVRDLGPFSSLWYVDLNGLNAFAVEEFYITVKDSDFGFISLGGSGYSTLHNPDFIQLNSASAMPASPSVSNIHVDRDPNGVGWNQGVEFDLTYSDLVDMSVLGDIMGYFNPSSVVVWYNYWEDNVGNWNSITAFPLAFTSDHTVRYHAEFHDDSYAPYSNVVKYYIQVREIGISGPFYQSNVAYPTLASVQANPLTFNQTYYMNPDIRDYLPPEIGIPTIPASCVDPALELDQVITCPVADLGGSRLAWARVYYRAGTQAWDIARYIPLVGGVAILPHNAWADFDVVEYYIGAGDNEGNIAYRGVAGLVPSDAAARPNPFSFTVGSNTVIFYKTQFLPTSTMHLFPRELGDDFTYTFTLQNVGNAPQEYEITTAGLVPYAMPAFIVPDFIQGVPLFQVSLAPAEILTFSLALSAIEPRKCNFTVITTSLTSGEVREIPASYFINMPPAVTPAGDVTYEHGTTGHALAWAITDTSPVPGKQNWYGIYSNATTATSGQFWATYTFDGTDSNGMPQDNKALPEGWVTDGFWPAGVCYGRLVINGWSSEEHSSVWVPFGDKSSGVVEWYSHPERGIMETGLFHDGVPVVTVTGGFIAGSLVPIGINGISTGQYYNYFSLAFDVNLGTCRVRAGNYGVFYWDSGEISLLESLVPNEFRVRITGYHMAPLDQEYVGLGAIDNLGFSWDPNYRVGDNAHVQLVQTGQFDPAGDILVQDIDGLLPDPMTGFADYKYVFLASDKWINSLTGRPIDLVSDFSVVRVLTPEPAVVPITGDISYEYGTTGHSLEWQVLDADAPDPSYDVWEEGVEIPGEYMGTETFRGVLVGDIPVGWTRDDPNIGVVDEWEGHASCLYVLSAGSDTHTISAAFTFPAQMSGTIEWYMYWDFHGYLDVNFGDDQGSLTTIRASSSSGRFQAPPGKGGFWYPLPTFVDTWYRFAFTFDAFTGTYSFTVYSYGCEGWSGGWDSHPINPASSYTWTGNFERQAAAISYIQFVSMPDYSGARPARWYIDSIGLSSDPLYEVGDLLSFEHEKESAATGTWTSGDIIQVPVDGLDVGTHELIFVAQDGRGYASSKGSVITVYNVAPVLTTVPSDLTFLAGTLAPSIEWVPSDASTRDATYRIMVDGIVDTSGVTWMSGIPIAWNPSGLPVGEHHVILELDDGLGGSLQDEVVMKSNDQVTFTGTPIDFSYHVGESTFDIGWIVSDLLGLSPTYSLYLRGFEGETGLGDTIDTGTWMPGPASTISVNLGGKPAGLYLASMIVSDGLGTQATDQVVFCVTPEGMTPLDWLESQLVEAGFGMTCGTSSGEVTVDVTFDTAEDTQVAIGIWDAPPQPLGPDFATEGTYFTVDAEREAAVTFPIYVTVTLPGGFPVGMTESDVAAWLRLLTFDEISGEWIDPQFPIVDVDLAGGSATFEVWHLSTFALGFANGLPPKIDGPGSLAYELNAPAPQLVTWRLADLTVGPNPTYTVFLNGASFAQGVWVFGTEVTVDASGLSLGTYDLEMIAFDDLGGVTSHHVPVEVCNMPPVVDQPVDVIYEAGSLGHSITWVPLDISVGVPTYVATVDGIQTESGMWVSGAGIPISVDGLMPGTHVVELTIGDGLGGSTSDQASVFVTNTAPVVAAQGTITYEAGDPRPVVEWVVTDPSVVAGEYEVYCDANPVAAGQWNSGVPFVVSVSGLDAGTHLYVCVATDGYGETSAGSVDVIVIPDDDVSPPVIVNVECTPVLDTAQWIPVKIFAFDSESGIGQVIIEYNGQSYQAELAGDYYAVNLPNPGVAGTLTAVVTAWDNDRDYPGDALSASRAIAVTFINTLPQLMAYYINTTLAGEYPATYTFSDHDLVPFSTGWVSGVQSIPGQPTPGVMGDYCRILPEYIGHKDVLQLFKNASVAQVITACFVGQEIPSGSVELWVAVEGDASFMAALSSFTAGISVWIVVVQGQLVFVSADGIVTLLGAFSPGWHRLQIDFAGAGTNLAALPENQIALTLDGISLGTLDAGAPLHVTGFAAAASQVGNASSPAEGSLYLDAVDFSWDSNYVTGRNRAPGIYLPQEPTPEVTIVAGEDSAVLQWLPSDVVSVNPHYEIILDGAHVTSGSWASDTLIAWNISGLEPGDYNVEMVLDDGMGGVATSQVILHVVASSHALLDEIDELIRLIEGSADSDWARPACQRKQEMINKLNEVKALILAGDLDEAYDKLLHDIKPKLTGQKTNEDEIPWGNGIYHCPWVTNPALQQECKDLSNSILRGLSPESGGTPPPYHHGWHYHPHHHAHGHHASPHGGCNNSAHHECNAASKKWCKN